MPKFEEPPMPEEQPEQEKKEKEQTPEEIRTVLEEALKKESPVDLIILTLDGKSEPVPDLLVEEIRAEKNYAY